jgi:F-type H+-transporting ATPase subunit delta
LVLVDEGRIQALSDVARAFRKEAFERTGKIEARITTARVLPDDELHRIVQALEQRTGRSIVPVAIIDESILAGLRVQIGGLVLDGTVRGRLDRLRALLG